jgi:hypothetical protein
VKQDQGAAARAVTVAHDEHTDLYRELLDRVAGYFGRRETRTACSDMLSGLLMELEDKNCWTIAEAVGTRFPTGCSTSWPARSGLRSRYWRGRRPGPPGIWTTATRQTRC